MDPQLSLNSEKATAAGRRREGEGSDSWFQKGTYEN